jgi:hypothetical protein
MRGVLQSLESFRASFIETMSLGMFIWTGCDGHAKIQEMLPVMSSLNDAAGLIIPKLAIETPWLVPVYLDMHIAVD